MAEDEDIEQDSEEYSKWRSGGDNDKYASSKHPRRPDQKVEVIQYQRMMMNMHYLEKVVVNLG